MSEQQETGQRWCSVCEWPIQRRNKSGICSSDSKCRRVFQQAWHRQNRANANALRPRCVICGGILRSNNKVGICTVSRECRRQRDLILYRTRAPGFRGCVNERARRRRARAALRRPRCRSCGGPVASHNRVGVCMRNSVCKARYVRLLRAWNRNHPEKVKLSARAYRERHRPKINARRLARKRLQGVRELVDQRGENHPSWAGGRHCLCGVCGVPLGWRTPDEIKPEGTFCKQCWHHRKGDCNELRNSAKQVREAV